MNTPVPLPGYAPDLLPLQSPDAVLVGLEVDAALEDIRVGVSFGTRKIYVYACQPLVHVGSLVLVPPSWFDPDPQVADVVTLDPPPYPGPIKRIIAVIS